MKTQAANLVYNPADVSTLGKEYLEWKQTHKEFGVPFFAKSMRNRVYPLFPGEMMSIIARPGHAKCLARGTKVVLFSGETIEVERVVPGDLLMGADSTPRRVLSIARGKEQMYWVRQNYAKDYRVNESHILSLKRSKNEYSKKHGETINISVRDVLQKGRSFLSRWKGYKTGVEYPEKHLEIEPYFMGLWLGDGTSTSSGISTTDKEVVEYLYEYARRRGDKITIGNRKKSCQTYSLVREKKKNNGSISSILKNMNLFGCKRIAADYMWNSRANRMALLAGLIDSDGFVARDGTVYFTLVKRSLVEDIKRLADSLGLRTSKTIMRRVNKSQNGTEVECWQISLNGDLSDCPVLLERKKKKANAMDMSMTGISIEKDVVDEYFGFTLDGDGLFLLEDYTVTHNTSVMMFWARQRARFLQENQYEKRAVIYATWEQSIEELHSFYIAAEQQLSITKMAKGELSEEDWKKVGQASADRINEPLWFIGHSMQRRSGRKPITVETLSSAIEQVQNFGDGFDVDCVFVDYLQRISPTKGMDNPVVAYTGILDELKNLALGFGVPLVVGVQARREVDDLNPPIPEQQHGQWTSNIEQSSDRILSLVRPRRYRKEGEMFGSRKVQGHTQLLASVIKQKLGEANFAEWLSFNPIYNRLDEKELVNPVPDE